MPFINSAVGRTSSGQEENFILSSRVVMSCNVTGLKEDKVWGGGESQVEL